MSVVIEVEKEVPIWLILIGVYNCCHVVKDNLCIQWIRV